MCVVVDEKQYIKKEIQKNRSELIELVECAEVVLRCIKKSIVDKHKDNKNDNNRAAS